MPSFRRSLLVVVACAALSLTFGRAARADEEWHVPTASADEPLPKRAPLPTGLTAEAARYEFGEGIERDYAMAADLYCRAARMGDADAAYRLGWMYANGRGLLRDDRIATGLFRYASERSHEYATRMLEHVNTAEAVLPVCMIPPKVIAEESHPLPFAWTATPERRRIVEIVREYAPAYGIDPRLALAIIQAESGFQVSARSNKNAQGLMQLIPETAERFNVRKINDPRENIRGGLAYLRWLLSFFEGDVILVTAAYNAGEHAVERYRGVPPYAETRQYVARVTGAYGKTTTTSSIRWSSSLRRWSCSSDCSDFPPPIRDPRNDRPMTTERRGRQCSRATRRRAGGLCAVIACLWVLTCGSAFADDESPLPRTIDRIRQSIVAIGTNEPTRNPSFRFRGTGFVVGDGSLVATNNHVIAADIDATKREVFVIAVPLADGEALLREASIVGRDVEHDLALLKVSGPPLPALRIGDSSRVREGEAFAFTGFPIGGVIGLFPATHRALVSAITPVALTQANSRSLDTATIRMLRQERFAIFQLDATAYPGNSGSPLFDMVTGDVMAIVNSTLVKAGKESALTQPSGISYAVPSRYLAQLLESIKGRAN